MSTGKVYPEAEYIKHNLTIEDYFNYVICKNDKSVYGSSVSFFNTPAVICPLHSENTGSFRYYEETNSFYCFGCGRGGDVIKLHQYYYSINFGIEKKFSDCIRDLNKIIDIKKGKTSKQSGSSDVTSNKNEVREQILGDTECKNSVLPDSKAKLAFVLEENRLYKFLYDNVKNSEDIVQVMKTADDIRSLFLAGELGLDDAIQYIRRQIRVSI